MGYTKDIVILYTNDVHCGIEDNLGYTKLAQYKEDLQQDTPYIALVDAGDAIQGSYRQIIHWRSYHQHHE